MPLRGIAVVKDQGHNTVSYRNANGDTFNGRVTAVSVARPAALATPGSSTSTTGGTLAALTYSYRVTKVVVGIESLPSVAKTQATTGATSTVTVTWVNDAAATSYNVYGRLAAGPETLMVSLPAATVQWIDDGSVTPGATVVPVALAANSVNLDIPGMPLNSTNGVQPATALRQSNRYYARPY
jgi:hypothetical protein